MADEPTRGRGRCAPAVAGGALVLALISIAAAGCDGCGADQSYPTRDAAMEMPVETGSVAIDAGFDLCPTAMAGASPSTVKVGQTINVHGTAADPDGQTLTLTWKADSGTFADASAKDTTFTCDRPGPVKLTLSVSDGVCTTEQSTSVYCVAVSDGGAGGSGGGAGTGAGGMGGGAGGTGGTGTVVNSCPTAEPSSGDMAICTQCTIDSCSLGSVESGASDGCCGLESTTDQNLCVALYVCIASNHCTTAGDPAMCYCGSAGALCNMAAGAANGPCVAQFVAAAKTTDPVKIKSQFTSPASPVGRAVNLASCRGAACPAECAIQ